MEKESIISRCYTTKNGETIVSFKFKFGDLTMQERADLEALWRDGTPLAIKIAQFQPNENTNEPINNN